jgi:hypothetical protein
MISAHNTTERVQPGPLTHRAYTGHYVSQALETGRTPVVHVQIRRRGVVLCGTVAEMVDLFDQSGREWFKVDCQLGRVWVESRNVRLCSGDGRCTCEEPVCMSHANTEGQA